MRQADPDEQRLRDRAYDLWQADGAPDGVADTYWHQARTKLEEDEQAYDEIVQDTFPASDPPAHSGTIGPGRSG